MSWCVELETRARREFLKLAAEVRRRLAEAIDDLAREARPSGARRLVGQDGYRIRQCDSRVLYTVDDPTHTVRIYRVGHRREVYRGH
ncbi:MAG: type II toxin-antitoxin system RelE/ParE family toxin [Planctomycetes bacterium]|nr:type II toxin-antitoxin system RelE/ParE family toxin [Planctomycetota bacterium]